MIVASLMRGSQIVCRKKSGLLSLWSQQRRKFRAARAIGKGLYEGEEGAP
jgi:hypothetical protein